MPGTVALPKRKTDRPKSKSVVPFETEPGRAHPLGATVDKDGVNFSVFSRNATAVELLLFDEHDDAEPSQIIKLDVHNNRTFFFWHVYIKGLKPGTHYAYRVDGPEDLHGKDIASTATRCWSTRIPWATPRPISTATTPSGRPTIWRPPCAVSSLTCTITTGRVTSL